MSVHGKGVVAMVAALFGIAACVAVWQTTLADDPLAKIDVRHDRGMRDDDDDATEEVVSETWGPIGVPVRITIPSIDVDASIEEVALAADGSMETPSRPHDAGWYVLGPRPGEMGSAAIAGHVDWMNGATAVFADLHKVRAGDKVAVRDGEGQDIDFVVREIRRYDADAEATEVFGSNDGRAHLNIITCDGPWDKDTLQYAKRLVVFTDRVTE